MVAFWPTSTKVMNAHETHLIPQTQCCNFGSKCHYAMTEYVNVLTQRKRYRMIPKYKLKPPGGFQTKTGARLIPNPYTGRTSSALCSPTSHPGKKYKTGRDETLLYSLNVMCLHLNRLRRVKKKRGDKVESSTLGVVKYMRNERK